MWGSTWNIYKESITNSVALESQYSTVFDSEKCKRWFIASNVPCSLSPPVPAKAYASSPSESPAYTGSEGFNLWADVTRLLGLTARQLSPLAHCPVFPYGLSDTSILLNPPGTCSLRYGTLASNSLPIAPGGTSCHMHYSSQHQLY